MTVESYTEEGEEDIEGEDEDGGGDVIDAKLVENGCTDERAERG